MPGSVLRSSSRRDGKQREDAVESTEKSPDPNIRLTTVFTTADPGLVAIVKSVLEEAGIDHFVRGETLA